MRIVRKFTVNDRTFGPGDEQAFLAAGLNARKFKALGYIDLPKVAPAHASTTPTTAPKTRRQRLDILNAKPWEEVQRIATEMGIRPHGVKRVKLTDQILDKVEQIEKEDAQMEDEERRRDAAERSQIEKEDARLEEERLTRIEGDLQFERRAALMDESDDTIAAICARYEITAGETRDERIELILRAERVAADEDGN